MPSARSKLDMYAAPSSTIRPPISLWQTVGRIYMVAAVTAVIGVAHIANGVKDSMQDSGAAPLHPIFWLASGTFLLAFAAIIGVNRNKWKFEHTWIRYWCIFMFAYFYIVRGQPGSSRSGSGWLNRSGCRS